LEINVLCETSDIIVLQETWLNNFDVQFLNTINDNLYANGISSMDSSTQVLTGRPFEGLGILWKSHLVNDVVLLTSETPYFLA